jgi:hypothetical protein
MVTDDLRSGKAAAGGQQVLLHCPTTLRMQKDALPKVSTRRLLILSS